jgi:hypothetical protein
VGKYGTARQTTYDIITRRMRIAFWITKATDKHSECVFLTAFPWQKWLRESASMLRLYIHCLSFFNCYKNPRCLQAMEVQKNAQNTMDSKKDENIGD